LIRRLGGPQSLSGGDEEEKNSQPPREIKPPNPDRPTHTQSLNRKTKTNNMILRKASRYQPLGNENIKAKVKLSLCFFN
jgi:hypothetical protein